MVKRCGFMLKVSLPALNETFFFHPSPPLLHPRFSVMCSSVSRSLVAQHGMKESGLYQLIHLQGSGAPLTENLDWNREPLRTTYTLILHIHTAFNSEIIIVLNIKDTK